MKSLRNKKWVLVVLSLCLLTTVLIVATPDLARAADAINIPSTQCGLSNISGCGVWIMFILFMVASAALTFAGAILDSAIVVSIIKMKDFVGAAQGIDIAWSVLRDTVNIFFIFILLFSAISMILRLGKFNPKDILPKLIIAALLINFSMFFTKVIIDASNILTLELYKGAEVAGLTKDPETKALELKGISYVFMKHLGVQVFLDDGDSRNALQKFLGGILPIYGDADDHRLTFKLLLGSIVVLITTFVFLSMAFMLILRLGILILLIVTSPIGFVGGLLPQLSEQSKKWWDTLIGQAVFAPVLMLFILITVLIIGNEGFQSIIKNSSGLIPTIEKVDIYLTNGVAILINYGIIIFLLITGLVTAKSMSGKAASGLTGWATKKAGGIAFGGVSAAGAYTFGRLGKNIADSDWTNSMKGSKNFWQQRLGSSVSTLGTKMGGASYDPRALLPDQMGGKPGSGYIDRMKQLDKGRKDAEEQLKKNMEARAKRPVEDAEREEALQLEAKIGQLQPELRARLNNTLTEEERERVLQRASESGIGNKELADAVKRLNELKANKSEKEIRNEVAEATNTITRADLNHITAVLDDPSVKAISDPTKKIVELTKRLNANEMRYVRAQEEMLSLQKRKDTQEKSYKARFAGEAANSFSGAERDLADKTRKELNKNQQQRAWEAVTKALKDEGIVTNEEKLETKKPEGAPPPNEGGNENKP